MMATGEIHWEYWKKFFVFIIAIFIWLLLSGFQVYLAVGFLLGYALGYLIDPDLDMTNMTSSKRRWKQTIIGYPVYLWWQVYAYTVARMFGGHRAFLNHFPFISTAVRLVWVFLPAIGYFTIAGFPEFSLSVLLALSGIYVGLSLADTLHFVLDVVY